jgi:hypothetical protein
MATNAQMKTALGITDSQITKALAYLDRVSPKTNVDGTARANAINDFRDHIVEHYSGQISGDLKQQAASPAWD